MIQRNNHIPLVAKTQTLGQNQSFRTVHYHCPEIGLLKVHYFFLVKPTTIPLTHHQMINHFQIQPHKPGSSINSAKLCGSMVKGGKSSEI